MQNAGGESQWYDLISYLPICPVHTFSSHCFIFFSFMVFLCAALNATSGLYSWTVHTVFSLSVVLQINTIPFCTYSVPNEIWNVFFAAKTKPKKFDYHRTRSVRVCKKMHPFNWTVYQSIINVIWQHRSKRIRSALIANVFPTLLAIERKSHRCIEKIFIGFVVAHDKISIFINRQSNELENSDMVIQSL